MCALFFVGMPIYAPQIQAPRSDLSFVSANVASEMPKALNLGMKAGSGTDGLQDFCAFARGRLLEQDMGMKGLWVVSETQGSGILVTVGNSMGQAESVSVQIDASSRVFELDDGESQSSMFPAGGQVEVQFSGRSWQGEWAEEKANLYAFIEIAKGGDIAVQEIEA